MNILDKILQEKKEEVHALRSEFSQKSFEEMELFHRPVMDVLQLFSDETEISLIAEVKKASPSRGILRDDFDYMEITRLYMENEVSAISVLTDKAFFRGSITFLNDISRKKSVPLLRKDFIIDEYQVLEARANGADFILLIAEALSAAQIAELTHIAMETGMQVLLELHSERQLEKINFNTNRLIGINNRNLEDFNVDLDTTRRIAALLPKDVIIVSESGIHNRADVDFIRNAGAKAVLVGEHFMKAPDIALSLQEMKRWCSHAG